MKKFDKDAYGYNTGGCNSGDYNSGHFNTGDYNSGGHNAGDYNSGDRNSGDRNSGDSNSGNYNSGYFCSCEYSAGVFMSERISYEAFNRSLSKQEYEKLMDSEGMNICGRFFLMRISVKAPDKNRRYIYASYKKSWAYFWSCLSFRERMAVRNIPYMDKGVFEEITGIRL
jgi:hypothetical protein